MSRSGLLFDSDTSGAEVSPCGRYRYVLWRSWYSPGYPAHAVNFVMLNPSTADAVDDDPTVRRCVGYAKAWGYGGLVVTNLFAFRATDPRALAGAADPVGPGNDSRITGHASLCHKIVCAWGTGGGRRAARVAETLRSRGLALYAIRLTKGGHPSHPLYLPNGLTPSPLP